MVANIDSNIWGLLVVPVGVVLGFGPVIIAWLWMTYGQTGTKSPRRPPEPDE
jgi:hypothetical protein